MENEMKFSRLKIELISVNVRLPPSRWTWGEQVHRKSAFLLWWQSDTRPSTVALIAFLCYLFEYALAHTHMHLKQLHSQTSINSYWLTEEDKTLNTAPTLNTHRDRHKHTHNAPWCALLSPSPAVFANDALVFLSLNALQNVWCRKMICCHHLYFCFF